MRALAFEGDPETIPKADPSAMWRLRHVWKSVEFGWRLASNAEAQAIVIASPTVAAATVSSVSSAWD